VQQFFRRRFEKRKAPQDSINTRKEGLESIARERRGGPKGVVHFRTKETVSVEQRKHAAAAMDRSFVGGRGGRDSVKERDYKKKPTEDPRLSISCMCFKKKDLLKVTREERNWSVASNRINKRELREGKKGGR